MTLPGLEETVVKVFRSIEPGWVVHTDCNHSVLK